MKRFNRSLKERKIAGVCGGLAEYFHTDPVFFRVLFVVALVILNVIAVVVYVIMWIVVPEESGQPGPRKEQRRICLSETEKKLTGVCGGLGEYFNIDPIFFRIVFIFFGLFGIGIVVYLVLWLIIPRPTMADAGINVVENKPEQPPETESKGDKDER